MSTHGDTSVNQYVPVRECLNIKSKRYPDVRCKSVATHGDFCTKHFKKPLRYVKNKDSFKNVIYTVLQEEAARKIQSITKLMLSKKNYRRQGPSYNILTVSENKTELQTMEELDTIPKLYIWSYADENKHIWTFDIRSFSHMMSLKNPYTQLQITEPGKASLEARLNWLKKKGYSTSFLNDSVLTEEQGFSLRVLDIFMKMDFLGYHSDSNWFLSLENKGQINLYKELYDLWNYRLQISPEIKEQICPGLDDLMRFDPYKARTQRSAIWWKKLNLNILDALLSRAPDKTNRALGAMYSLTALVRVSEDAREVYDWLA
jgi:hypothetical protein